MDFKVKCVRVEPDDTDFTEGKIYSAVNGKLIDNHGRAFEAWSLPTNGCGDFVALKKWFARWCDFELVEDTTVFTKEDIKTGMFGVMSNGWKFVIVNDLIVYENGEWDTLDYVKDDLSLIFKKIDKLYTGCHCFNEMENTSRIKLVYDRERDTKPKYNGKVVCIKSSTDQWTVGKIYEVKDGIVYSDHGWKHPRWGEPYKDVDDIRHIGGVPTDGNLRHNPYNEFIEIKE